MLVCSDWLPEFAYPVFGEASISTLRYSHVYSRSGQLAWKRMRHLTLKDNQQHTALYVID